MNLGNLTKPPAFRKYDDDFWAIAEYLNGSIEHFLKDILPYWLTLNSNTREEFEKKASNSINYVQEKAEDFMDMIKGIFS